MKLSKLITVGSLSLISFSVFYYLVIFLPQKQRKNFELQQLEQLMEQAETQVKIDALKKDLELKENRENGIDQCFEEAERLAVLQKEADVVDGQTKVDAFKAIAGAQDHDSEQIEAFANVGRVKIQQDAERNYQEYLESLKNDCFEKYSQ